MHFQNYVRGYWLSELIALFLSGILFAVIIVQQECLKVAPGSPPDCRPLYTSVPVLGMIELFVIIFCVFSLLALGITFILKRIRK